MGSGTETTFSMNPETDAAQREEWRGQEPVEMLGLEHPCLGLRVMRAEGLHGLSSVRWVQDLVASPFCRAGTIVGISPSLHQLPLLHSSSGVHAGGFSTASPR